MSATVSAEAAPALDTDRLDRVVDRAQAAAHAFRRLDQETVDNIVWEMTVAGTWGVGDEPRACAPDESLPDGPVVARSDHDHGCAPLLGDLVLKEAADEELIAAVEAAVEGRSYLNAQLAARVATAPPRSSGPPDGLSEREAEVLRLIALGHTNAEIAEQLYLSIRHR